MYICMKIKKEQHTLVAVPELEWSTIISYEEEKKALARLAFTIIQQAD